MRKLLICLMLVILVASPLWAVGTTVGKGCTISWSANTEADLAGYHLFVGTVSGSYGPAQTVLIPATSITCAGAGITADGQYFVTLTAYDIAGNESTRAVELPFQLDGIVPAVPSGLAVN